MVLMDTPWAEETLSMDMTGGRWEGAIPNLVLMASH